MNPIEVLLLRFVFEIRDIFKNIKNGSYNDIAGEILYLIEGAMQKLIAEIFGVQVGNVEDARVTLAEEFYDDRMNERLRVKIEDNDDNEIAVRDFTELVNKILELIGVNKKVRAAGAGLIAKPVEGVVGDDVYILQLRVQIDEYYELYDIMKVPMYHGSVGVVAIPADHLEIDIDCECSCPAPEDLYGVVRNDGTVDLYRR